MIEDSSVRNGLVLGIDVGSVSISVVSLDANGQLFKEAYALHHGNICHALINLLSKYDLTTVRGIASPSGKSHFRKSVRIFDQQVSILEGMSYLGCKARSVLHVGAERFLSQRP